jgi:deoxyribodipyrimidine photo-lyase
VTQPVIMWFRQDLRLADNAALSAAAAAGSVLPLFILDDETPGAWRWGGASRWWLHKSLTALAAKVPLVLRRGEPVSVLEKVIKESGATALYFARDYAPWSPALEQQVKALCERLELTCHRHGGFLLHEPEAIRSGAGQYFKVYTPFSRAAFAVMGQRAPRPAPNPSWWRGQQTHGALDDWHLLPKRPNWAVGFESLWRPGEDGGRKRLVEFLENGLRGYAEGRDRPDKSSTSRLSPHLHWGEISPLQVWHASQQAMTAARGSLDRDGEKFLKEILWREFSHHLLHHVPRLPEEPFRTEFKDFPWTDDLRMLKNWRRGETGYPIVDAGMRQLWATGTMHNRVRMIVASFLVKHLLIPWQEGEKWFWDTLVDADIGNNAASWQWVAGCGADAAPYFRIFNPVLQGEKFDPDGTYVRKWVPELKDVPNAFVHHPWDMAEPPVNYAAPIIAHGLARTRALAAFNTIKKDNALE